MVTSFNYCTTAVKNQLNAHDFLWGMTTGHLPLTAPDWAYLRLKANIPVIVRRDEVRASQVAVGIRGINKNERYATWLPFAHITSKVKPEQIRTLPNSNQIVQKTLAHISNLLREKSWGIVGSYAFEAVTGEPATTENSDLDILLRQETAMNLGEAKCLFSQISQLSMRVDMQIDTGEGAFSLRDWVTTKEFVLLKTASKPKLVLDPWGKEGAK